LWGNAGATAILGARAGRGLAGIGARGGEAARGAAGVRARRGTRGAVRLAQAGGPCAVGRGQLAGAPEGEHVAEMGQQASEAGENEGVQGRNRSGPLGEVGGVAVGFRAQGGQEAGGAWGRGGGLVLHLGQYT